MGGSEDGAIESSLGKEDRDGVTTWDDRTRLDRSSAHPERSPS